MHVHNNSHKIIDGLTTAFYVAFSILMLGLCTLQASIFGFLTSVGSVLIFSVLLLMTVVADSLTNRYRINHEKLWQLLTVGTFAVLLAYISCQMTCALPSDTQILYDSVAALLEHGTLDIPYDFSVFYPDLGFYTLADYYCRCHNNIAMLLVLTAIYSVGSLFGITAGSIYGQSLAVFVTAICVAVAVHYLCKSAQYIFKGTNTYFMCLAINILFLSYYYSCPNFYTDIWILCPVACGFYCSLKFYSTKKKSYLFLCSVLWAIGSQLKITAAIPIIAFGIFIIFEKENSFPNKIIHLLWLLIPFAVLIVGFQTWYRNSSMFDFSRHEELYYPFTVWISYGSHGLGGYHYEDSLLAYHTPFHLRKQVMANHIKEIFASYTPSEYFQFLKNKLSFIWGDGLFEGGTYAEWALFENWTNFFTNSECWGKGFAQLWSNSFSLMLSACGAVTAILQIRKRDNHWLLFINIIAMGLFLYLCIFEGAPRRAIPAVLMFMFDAVYLLKKFSNHIRKKAVK